MSAIVEVKSFTIYKTQNLAPDVQTAIRILLRVGHVSCDNRGWVQGGCVIVKDNDPYFKNIEDIFIDLSSRQKVQKLVTNADSVLQITIQLQAAFLGFAKGANEWVRVTPPNIPFTLISVPNYERQAFWNDVIAPEIQNGSLHIFSTRDNECFLTVYPGHEDAIARLYRECGHSLKIIGNVSPNHKGLLTNRKCPLKTDPQTALSKIIKPITDAVTLSKLRGIKAEKKAKRQESSFSVDTENQRPQKKRSSSEQLLRTQRFLRRVEKGRGEKAKSNREFEYEQVRDVLQGRTDRATAKPAAAAPRKTPQQFETWIREKRAKKPML